MKKRILTVLFASAMVLNMTGCIATIKKPETTTSASTHSTTTAVTTANVATTATTTTLAETEDEPVETTTINEAVCTDDEHDFWQTAANVSNCTVFCNVCHEKFTPAKPDETTTPAETIRVTAEIDDIEKICGLKSDVETDIKACAVDVFDEHNPYDVVYDYGTAYNAYVDACNWDLVFDADYYIEQFPMLATLYHNDKALLLEHFQTVGIHEGRQGSADFNVGAYKANCDSDVRNAFGNNYEGYYFYYMLNHKTEKSVKTTGSKYEIQYKQIMTKCQADELTGVNNYRDEVNVADIAFDSELAAFANYRAWTNAHDDWRGHKWTYESKNHNFIINYAKTRNARSVGENTTYNDYICKSYGQTYYDGYRKSEPHYKAMINANYDLIGLSNVYYSWSDTFTNHFQTFLNL